MASSELDSLMAQVRQRGHYGKRYESAQTVDKLMALLSEAIVLSAVPIFKALRPPERGVLILWIMKKISRTRYEHFLEITDNLWAQILLYLTYLLGDFLKVRSTLKDEAENIAFKAAVAATAAFAVMSEWPIDQKQMFRDRMFKAIEQFRKNPPKDQNDALDRIWKARGLTSKATKTMANFLRASLVDDPLSLIEPWVFEQRWKLLVPI